MAVKCKSCNADIIWAKTPKGKMMPLDPLPSERGNVQYEGYGSLAVVLTALELAAAKEEGLPLYLSHYASCPDANHHRKTKGESP